MPRLHRTAAERVPGAWLVVSLLALAACATAWRWIAGEPLRANAAGAVDMRIDINRADDPQLNILPGIGPALAARIVADREANGRYARTEDLTRVPGIGPRIVERIEPHVVAGEEEIETRAR